MLSSLSTPGLMEYLMLRYNIEYDYLEVVVEQLHNRLNKIQDVMDRIVKMSQDREVRQRVV